MARSSCQAPLSEQTFTGIWDLWPVFWGHTQHPLHSILARNESLLLKILDNMLNKAYRSNKLGGRGALFIFWFQKVNVYYKWLRRELV
jgi:hypothetical protein